MANQESPLWDTGDSQSIGFFLTRYQEWQQIKGFSESHRLHTRKKPGPFFEMGD